MRDWNFLPLEDNGKPLSFDRTSADIAKCPWCGFNQKSKRNYVTGFLRLEDHEGHGITKCKRCKKYIYHEEDDIPRSRTYPVTEAEFKEAQNRVRRAKALFK